MTQGKEEYKFVGSLREQNFRTISKPAEKDSFEKIKLAKKFCLASVQAEEKFALLIDNYFEFELELLRLAQVSLVWPSVDHNKKMDERLLLDKRVVNFLSTCRLYKDHICHALSSNYGKSSKELKSFNATVNKCYDAEFGFRLLETVRNYVQHAGLLVNQIRTLQGGIGGKLQNSVAWTIIPSAKIGVLLESKSIKGQVRQELEKITGHQGFLDVRQPIRTYTKCWKEVHESLRSLIGTDFSKHRGILETAEIDSHSIEGKKVDLPRIVKVRNGQIEEEIHLMNPILARYDQLILRNTVTQRLEDSFACNAILKP